MDNKIYEIVTKKIDSLYVPNVCPCCLEPAERKWILKDFWVKPFRVRVYRSITFRECNTCYQHKADFLLKMWLFFLCNSAFSSIATRIALKEFSASSKDIFLIAGIVLACSLALFTALIKFKELPLGHICRTDSVMLWGARPSKQGFSISNPNYARMFADMNDFSVTKTERTLCKGNSRFVLGSWKNIWIVFFIALICYIVAVEPQRAKYRDYKATYETRHI